ncbi:MAG TPA: nitroreductase/quinone reductase family protein [Acidimicrobiia bacterium]
MTLPRWLARFNRQFINPRAAQGGNWPVLVHAGRSSGNIYRTPIGAIPVDGGFLIFVNYGRRTDWLRNVLAAHKAALDIDDEIIEVANPRLVPFEDGKAMLGPDAAIPPGWAGVEECLLLDRL